MSHFSYALALEENALQHGAAGSLDPVLMDDQALAKTAGSPAFYAPELCYTGEEFQTQPITSAPVTTTNTAVPAPETLTHHSPPTGIGLPHSQSLSDTVLRKKPKITKAIDVWALGVTLYCLLFGRTPFDAETTFQLYQVIPREDYTFPDRMGADAVPTRGSEEGREVIYLLSRLMEKDPERRITLSEVKVRYITITRPRRENEKEQSEMCQLTIFPLFVAPHMPCQPIPLPITRVYRPLCVSASWPSSASLPRYFCVNSAYRGSSAG